MRRLWQTDEMATALGASLGGRKILFGKMSKKQKIVNSELKFAQLAITIFYSFLP